MPFDFFESCLSGGMNPAPKTMYDNNQQAFINETWENTAVKSCIEEQDIDSDEAFKAFTFHKIDAWWSYVVGQTSSGSKNGDDFVQLNFRSICHPCVKGRYYKFDDNYWLAYYTNDYDGVDKSLAVRRCDNFMRIVDPENGKIFSIPCVVEYDMSAPNAQVTRYILTPNNHATVKVQGNSDTYRLFKLNTRYILGGRPFKIYGYQNAILDKLNDDFPNMMTLELFLDELHDGDDLENQLADNGDYVYNISINSGDMELTKGSKGKLTTDITLNGVEVEREIDWTSSSKFVRINETGEYEVVGEAGDSAVIRATLVGNESAYSEIKITVSEVDMSKPIIMLDPSFDKIREYESVKVDLIAVYNGVEYKDITESNISLSPNSIVYNSKNLSIEKNGNKYVITCNKFAKEPVNLYISVKNEAPAFEAQEVKPIKLATMLG